MQPKKPPAPGIGQKVIWKDTELREAQGGCNCPCHREAGVMHSHKCCKADPNKNKNTTRNPHLRD